MTPDHQLMALTGAHTIETALDVVDAHSLREEAAEADRVSVEVVLIETHLDGRRWWIVRQHHHRQTTIVAVTPDQARAHQVWRDTITTLTELHWDGREGMWPEAEWLTTTPGLHWQAGWIDPAAIAK